MDKRELVQELSRLKLVDFTQIMAQVAALNKQNPDPNAPIQEEVLWEILEQAAAAAHSKMISQQQV